jgi:hypothetical protein
VTSAYGGCYVIKLNLVESLASGSASDEVKLLAARIEAEDSAPPPLVIRPDGVAVGSQYRGAAERLIDNPRINREGKEELYLDVDAPQASINVTQY